MHEASAWLVEFSRGIRAALGYSELVHVVPRPKLFEIPLAPSYCRHVVLWQGAILPALDLAAFLTAAKVERDDMFAGIISYQAESGAELQRGAILASGMPVRIGVTDEQACDLPEQPDGWRRVACSCFRHAGQPVPVLDLAHLFSPGGGLEDELDFGNRCDRSAGGMESSQSKGEPALRPWAIPGQELSEGAQ
jgi:chemotaxis signal transduction protein